MACITNDRDRYWRMGIVPFTVDRRSFPSSVRAQILTEIRSAMDHWERNAPVRFVDRTDEPDYLTFAKEVDGVDLLPANACYSVRRTLGVIPWSPAIGRVGGQQFIICIQDLTLDGTYVHEIGHALGFFHTQQRSDRDNFVSISPALQADVWNFGLPPDGEDVGAYDCLAAMHYRARLGFSGITGGCTTSTMGTGVVLGTEEIQAAEQMYGGQTISTNAVFRNCMNITGNISVKSRLTNAQGSVRKTLMTLENIHC